MEVTPDGPLAVRMVPVRINVNLLAVTCDAIVGQKRNLHCRLHMQLFEYGMQVLPLQLMEEGDRFTASYAQDT